jgi:hypothetical protein
VLLRASKAVRACFSVYRDFTAAGLLSIVLLEHGLDSSSDVMLPAGKSVQEK